MVVMVVVMVMVVTRIDSEGDESGDDEGSGYGDGNGGSNYENGGIVHVSSRAGCVMTVVRFSGSSSNDGNVEDENTNTTTFIPFIKVQIDIKKKEAIRSCVLK